MRLVIALLSIVLAAGATAQTNCTAVLGAVYDRTNSSRYYVASRSMENFFCSRTFSSESEARDAGAQVALPIDGLPLQLGGHSRRENWREYQQELCHIIREHETVDDRTFLELERVNAQVIQAWERCVTSTQPGFYFHAEIDDAARTVSFIARFEGLENNQVTTRLRPNPLVLTPAGVLRCSSRFPTEIGRRAETVACERPPSADGALTAVLRTRTAGSPRASIRAMASTEAVVKPCVRPTLLSAGARADASRESPGAAAVTDGRINPGNWNAGDFAPQWVRVFLPQPSTVTHMSLNPEQTPAGRTVNLISVFRRNDAGEEEEVIVTALDQSTISGGVVTAVMGQQRNVTAVRVHTTASPAWVSWREVEIFGCPQ